MRRLVLLALAVLACGEEEGIIQVRPVISVCPSAEAVFAECDQPIDLGEIPIEVEHPVELFVVDRGEGPLVVSAIGGTAVTSEAPVPFTVPAGVVVPISVMVTPSVLGPGSALLSIDSDDTARSPYLLDLTYVGTPKPAPKIELCVEDVCGTEVTLDFGLVRRSQRESAPILVRNAGNVPLAIEEVAIEGAASSAGELTLATSTRPGELEVGGSANVVVVYEPKDGAADQIALVFTSDDPAAMQARATVLGTSDANAPPIADAREVDTASTSAEVSVEQLVVLDGAASRDPEGDPLLYVWTLSGPPRSRAQIDDPGAGLVTFVPDVAGDYRADLTVIDSLGQSSAIASVMVTARPRFAFRAHLRWQGGGDVDLLLIHPSGDVLSFENPRPAWGAELRNDEEAAPGGEEIVFESPAAGTYELWAYYFDDGGLGAASANVEVIFDDASTAVFSSTTALDQTCSLWHVGDYTYAPSAFTPSSDPVAVQCR
jgi:hypothetical protein